MIEVANAIYNLADYYAVGRVEEGVYLKRSGIYKPVLSLISTNFDDEIEDAILSGVELTICNINQLKKTNEIAKRLCLSAVIHLKIDTGMNRQGLKTKEDIKVFLKEVRRAKNVILKGVYSHLFNNESEKECKKQLDLFLSLTKEIKEKYPDVIRHISASGGVLLGKEYNLDMVRVGLLSYGYNPPCKNQLTVKPILKVYAPVLERKIINANENVGYGDFKVDREEKVTLLRLGYADGFRRKNTNFFKNNLCMDLSFKSGFIEGDYAEIFGEKISLCDLSLTLNTIPYELLVSLTTRAEIIYDK